MSRLHQFPHQIYLDKGEEEREQSAEAQALKYFTRE
jgi:hypothetical protein